MHVTVIIPSYNHCDFVVEAIDSVLDQGWQDLDLLVIDDGSTDNSVERIEAHCILRGGFQCIARENRGLIRTVAEGLERAQGEAFCLLASDDTLLPASIACRAQALAEHPDDVAVFADGQKEELDGSCSCMLDDRRRACFGKGDPIPRMLDGYVPPIHTMLARVHVAQRVGGFDIRYRRVEDLELQLRLFLAGPIGFVDALVYRYRRHETNISRQPAIVRGDKVRLYQKLLHEVPELAPYRRQIRRRLSREFLKLARAARDGTVDDEDCQLLQGAWPFALREPRLLGHLLRSPRGALA